MAKRKKARKKPNRTTKRMYNAAYRLRKKHNSLFGAFLTGYMKANAGKKPQTAKAAERLIYEYVAKSMQETRTFSFRDIYEQVLRPSGYEISGSDDPLFDYVADDEKYNKQMNFYEFKDDLEKVLKAVKSANETRPGFDKDVFLFQVDMFIKNIRD